MEQTQRERAAEIRRAYQKEWRAKNKDRVREYNRRFWEKQAAKKIELTDDRTTQKTTD